MNRRGGTVEKRGKVGFHVTSILDKAGRKNGKSDHASPPAQPPKCPECTLQKVWKDGIRYTRHGEVQRYLCRSCGYRFSKSSVKVNVPSQRPKSFDSRSDFPNVDVTGGEFSVEKRPHSRPFQRGENVASHSVTMVAKPINTFRDYNSDCQVCVDEEKMKNLVKVETRTEKQAAGATKKPTKADVKGKIIEYIWWLRKQGYAQSTIEGRAWFLKRLGMLGANIFDPNSTKEVIARQETWNEGSKLLAGVAYASFAQMAGIRFEPPRYRPIQKFPFIPTEEEIDQLIAACGKVISTFLQLLKETGVRLGEAWTLQWTDFDMKNRNVRITPEKGSNPRILPISMKLIEMLNNLPKKSEKVFTCSSKRIMNTNFYMQRKRIARKLCNPRLLKITFHTLRHWKATMEYHKTKDILYVMKTLGHKAIQSTLIYIDLERGIFNSPKNDEYTVRVANTLDEACNLLEAGFEYVTNMDYVKIFRKRK